MSQADQILSEMQALGTPEKAAHLSKFFKTGKGEYGEGDRFLGIPVPGTRRVAKAHLDTPFEDLHTLLESPWHEIRLCALLILVERFKRKKTTEAERESIYHFYLQHTKRCNNWDLVDLSCPTLVGGYLLNRADRSVLYRLAESACLWEQRIAMVSTYTFIYHKQFDDAIRLAQHFMTHRHDLMHKAVGWMLREIGKRNRPVLSAFLEEYASQLPRTALRYAIEHYPEAERKRYLARK